MLDCAVLCTISWMGYLGYRLGAHRMVIQVSSFVGAYFVAREILPSLRAIGLNPTAATMFESWLKRLVDTVVPVFKPATAPALAGLPLAPGASLQTWRSIYTGVLTLGYAACLYLGVHMARRCIDTLIETKARRPGAYLGAVIGTACGIWLALVGLETAAATAYGLHSVSLQGLFYRSLVARIWIQWISRGIVN